MAALALCSDCCATTEAGSTQAPVQLLACAERTCANLTCVNCARTDRGNLVLPVAGSGAHRDRESRPPKGYCTHHQAVLLIDCVDLQAGDPHLNSLYTACSEVGCTTHTVYRCQSLRVPASVAIESASHASGGAAVCGRPVCLGHQSALDHPLPEHRDRHCADCAQRSKVRSVFIEVMLQLRVVRCQCE
jgi:hypothetical protein